MSGVILTVLPAIDEHGRVRLQIHPEVSTGVVSEGLPNQQTTEVTTQLIVADGQTVFIGGLIRNTGTNRREGVPLLGDIPLLGALFSNRERTSINTETVLLITPHIVETERLKGSAGEVDKRAEIDEVVGHEHELDKRVRQIDDEIDDHPLAGFRPYPEPERSDREPTQRTETEGQ